MSVASKITLLSSVFVSSGIIGYILYEQRSDKERLYSGIAKDVQRQQQHKIENTFILQQQLQLAKKLKAEEENELQTKVKG